MAPRLVQTAGGVRFIVQPQTPRVSHIYTHICCTPYSHHTVVAGKEKVDAVRFSDTRHALVDSSLLTVAEASLLVYNCNLSHMLLLRDVATPNIAEGDSGSKRGSLCAGF